MARLVGHGANRGATREQARGRANGTASPYAGPDRRAAIVPSPPNPREFVLAGAILVVVTLPFWLVDGRGPFPDALDARSLNSAVIAMTALLAVVVGSAGVLRWRIIGEAVSVRIGLAVLLLGAASAIQVVALVVPTLDEAGLLIGVAPAARLVALGVLLVAFVAPDVDNRIDVRRLIATVACATGALAAIIDMVPWLGRPIGWSDVLDGVVAGATPVRLVTVALLGGLAVCYTRRGLVQSRWLHTWIGMMLFALTLSSALSSFVASPSDVRLTAAAVLALLGLGFALNGTARELAAAYTSQRALLFDREVHLETVESLQRAERAAREEQAHDAQSALLSVQAALRVLERQSGSLARPQRDRLAAALDAELTRLRDLLSSEPDAVVPHLFRISDAIAPVTVCRSAVGAQIHETLPVDLEAYGRPAIVAEIVDNLIANAQRHAPGSPIWVSAEGLGGAAAIRVEDAGPGIAANERERVFERGRHGSAGGTGLGLFVARRLARDQGGDLWVEPSVHGGAALVLRLPIEAAQVAQVDVITGTVPGDGTDEMASSMLGMRRSGDHGTLASDNWRVVAGGAPGL